MKKIINNPADVVDEMLDGMAYAYTESRYCKWRRQRP